MKNYAIITTTSIMMVSAFTMQVVYGQTLDELENQVNQTVGYRAELLDYMNSHNLTFSGPQSLIETSDLERTVKQHMEDCKSGALEEKLKLYEEAVGEKVDRSPFGTC